MLRVRPSAVRGAIDAPPSKSHTHRALVMGYLTGAPFVVENALVAGDTRATMGALEALGAAVALKGRTVRIDGSRFRVPARPIDAANSGTTLRVVAAVAALLPGTTLLTGDASLRRRPMGPLLAALEQLGARCRSEGGHAPVAVTGPLAGGEAALPGDVSSQFTTALLIACPRAAEGTRLHVLPPRKSEAYVAMTLALLRRFGIAVEELPTGFAIPGGQAYRGSSYTVPGDYSSAAFPLVAGAIAGGPVAVRGLGGAALQGDARIVDLLRAFGARVEVRGDVVAVAGNGLRGRTVDVSATPDLFPILAVLGSQAEGRTQLVGGEQLRHKESDRIATTVRFLTRMGARVEERPDGCIVEGGGGLRGAVVDCAGDHRILMAAAIAALAARGETLINHPSCHAVSYPAFPAHLRALGAEVDLV